MGIILTIVAYLLFAGSNAALAAEPSGESSAFDFTQMGEQEKLYRYFGVAAGFCEEKRYEEAVEILEYILDKNPQDDYIREYLKRAKSEMQGQKTEWERNTKKEAGHFKKKRIKNLIQEGTLYYKAGDFDKALARFSDTLSLDPDNPVAQGYAEKLKKHYKKDLRIEYLVQNKDGVLPDKTDTSEIKYLELEKKAKTLLNQTELGLRIEEIISAEKSAERRSQKLTLGPGDMLQISVLDHPELSGEVTVRINGEIVLPLVNDLVIAKGLTLEELSKEVKKTMKRYVQDPRINVSAIEYKSKLYYVIDEVGCTSYPITSADLTLRDALLTADWGDNRALGRILLTKPSKRHPIVKKVDGFDLVYRGELEDDIRIEDGDVIYIPMTVAAKVTKTIRDLLGPFSAIRQARDNYLNLKWNEKDWKATLRLPPDYDAQSEDSEDVRLENISLYDYIVTR